MWMCSVFVASSRGSGAVKVAAGEVDIDNFGSHKDNSWCEVEPSMGRDRDYKRDKDYKGMDGWQ